MRLLWDERNVYLAAESTAPGELDLMLQPDVTSRAHHDRRILRGGEGAPPGTAIKTSAGGWSVEMALPLAGLVATERRDLTGERWGLNLYRRDAAGVTTAIWSRPLAVDLHAVEQCGDLVFTNEEGEDPAAAFERDEDEREELEQKQRPAVY